MIARNDTILDSDHGLPTSVWSRWAAIVVATATSLTAITWLATAMEPWRSIAAGLVGLSVLVLLVATWDLREELALWRRDHDSRRSWLRALDDFVEASRRQSPNADMVIDGFDAALGALRQGGELVRRRAVVVLGAMEDPRAPAALATVLADDAPVVRQMAAEAIAKRGDVPDAVPLLDSLQDSDPLVRRWVAAALAHADEPSVVEALAAMLSDPEAMVWAAAVESLGRLADRMPSAAAALSHAALHGPSPVRLYARSVLVPVERRARQTARLADRTLSRSDGRPDDPSPRDISRTGSD